MEKEGKNAHISGMNLKNGSKIVISCTKMTLYKGAKIILWTILKACKVKIRNKWNIVEI